MTQPTIERAIQSLTDNINQLEQSILRDGVQYPQHVIDYLKMEKFIRAALAEKLEVDRSLSIARDALTAIMVLKPGSPEAAIKQCAFVSKLAKEALAALSAQREGK